MAEYHTPAHRGGYAGAAPRGRPHYRTMNPVEEAQHLRVRLHNCLQHKQNLQMQIVSMTKNADNKDVQNLKALLEAKQKELEAKEQEFLEEREMRWETNKKHESLMSHLARRLKVQVEDKEAMEVKHQEELHKLMAQLEEEKEKVLKLQEEQLLKVRAMEETNSSISNDYQKKLDELTEKLCQKENENMQLHKETQRLSERLIQTSVQLWEKEAENSFMDKTWQEKYNSLQEKVNKELAETLENWETRVKEVEDEKTRLQEENRKLVEENAELMEDKKELEDKKTKLENEKENLEKDKTELEQSCIKLQKKKRRFWFHLKKKSENVAAQTEAEPRMSKKEKMEEKQEKEEKREMKNKQMEKKKEKEEKVGCWSWMHKKHKWNSDSKVEVASSSSSFNPPPSC